MRGVGLGALSVAARKVEVLAGRYQWLEALRLANKKRRTIVPNSFYNGLLLAKGKPGRFKPLPEDIVRAMPLLTGTAGVVGPWGKQFGKKTEALGRYFTSTKTMIFNTESWQRCPANTVLLCDQGFAKDGTPFIQLSDARTGKQIISKAEMHAATEVLVTFNGPVRQVELTERTISQFEKVGDDATRIFTIESSALALIVRGYGEGARERQNVFLGPWAHLEFGVAVEATDVR